MDPEDLDALAAQAEEQKIRDFLTGIKSVVGIDNFVEVVGADLLASRVLNAAEFGSPPNALHRPPAPVGLYQTGDGRGRAVDSAVMMALTV